MFAVKTGADIPNYHDARMNPNSDLQAIHAARKTPDTLQNLESSLDGAR